MTIHLRVMGLLLIYVGRQVNCSSNLLQSICITLFKCKRLDSKWVLQKACIRFRFSGSIQHSSIFQDRFFNDISDSIYQLRVLNEEQFSALFQHVKELLDRPPNLELKVERVSDILELAVKTIDSAQSRRFFVESLRSEWITLQRYTFEPIWGVSPLKGRRHSV